MPPAIVFDLDGTLIHSAPDIHLAVTWLLDKEGLPPLDLPTVTSFIGNGLPKLTERVMRARDIDLDRHEELSAALLEKYNAVNGTLTRLYPGVEDASKTLAASGHPSGMCTNKPYVPSRDVLEHFSLTGFFGAVVGGDTLAVKKPAPDGLHLTFEKLGRPGIYVGDSEVDAATAQAAGVPFALFSGGYRKTPVSDLPHDVLFDDFADLPGLIETLAKRVA